MSAHIIAIAVNAPAKPAEGEPCNGCGVCCLLEPCPLGVVLSWRRHGACIALRWREDAQQYRCAAVDDPQALLRQRWPGWLHWTVPPAAALLARLAPRWIAAARGCDASLAVTSAGSNEHGSQSQIPAQAQRRPDLPPHD